jgi:hypothetical protein
MHILEEKLSNNALEIKELKNRLHKGEQKTAALEKLVNSIKERCADFEQLKTAEHYIGCPSHQWKLSFDSCSKCCNLKMVCHNCNLRKCTNCSMTESHQKPHQQKQREVKKYLIFGMNFSQQNNKRFSHKSGLLHQQARISLLISYHDMIGKASCHYVHLRFSHTQQNLQCRLILSEHCSIKTCACCWLMTYNTA